MKNFTLFKGFFVLIVLSSLSLTAFSQTVTLSPSGTTTAYQNAAAGFTATRGGNWGSNENFGYFTFHWSVSPSSGVTISNNDDANFGLSSSTAQITFANTGTYTVTCTVSRWFGTSASSSATTVNVVAQPAANLWATSSDGTRVSSFTVSNGTYINGPNNIFDPTIGGSVTATAALGRTAQPNPTDGYFYWLPNDGSNGLVKVYGSKADGSSRTLLGSLDVNGSSNADLGFVRLGMGPDNKGWILAGDGSKLYLASFQANLLNSVTITVVDDNVSLSGGTAGTFQNGDVCLSGSGTLYALANNGSGTTQIFTGSPNGTNTTLTKRWDLINQNGSSFTGRVNGVAFDVLGSLYLSTDDGLYYINQSTVNGPAGTVQCSLVKSVSGLQDLASNVFPNQTTLPVHLLSFTGSLRNNIATLNWDAENEINFSHYEIERSVDGRTFAGIANQSGTGTGRKSYQFNDDLSAVSSNVVYYRLKNVDADGAYSYSKVVMLRKDQKAFTGVAINPNPVVNATATVRFNSTVKANVSLRVIDGNGKVVLQQQEKAYEGVNSIPVNNLDRLMPGIYLLQLDNQGELNTVKFTVVR